MSALDVLLTRIKAMTPEERMALAQSLGLDPELGRIARYRQQYHHGVNGNAFLAFCWALGIDPLTGGECPQRLRKFKIEWAMIGAALKLARWSADASLQTAANTIGVSKPTIFRIEAGLPLSVPSLITVTSYLELPPERYAIIGEVPRETMPTALKSQEAA
jgi:DNA-binding XRE family transcriptional regulator